MPDSQTDRWIDNIQQTMALDLSIALQQGLPPKAVIRYLFRVPEVAQAFHLRARSKLDIDIDTPAGQAIAVERLTWVADFLDDRFHESCVTSLREVIADLTEGAS